MNKLTKASIATGAGIVLLLGGAGTLAFWNDSATTDAGTITAGTLTIDSNDDGQWKDVSADVAGNPTDIDSATFLAVPGDTLTYTETFEVGATGDNLKANVTINPGSITSGAWADELTVTSSTTIAGSPVTSITSSNDGDTVTVTVTLAFAFDGDVVTGGTQVNNLSQGAVVDLSALAITLTQVRP